MAEPWYCTREQVMRAADAKESAHNHAQIDQAIAAASRSIDAVMCRRFYPTVATRWFDWPNSQYAPPWRLWLDDQEVIEVTELVAGGVVIDPEDYFLEPVNSGPPYTAIEIDLESSAAFTSGGTHQRQIKVTGVFGYRDDQAPAGELAVSVGSSATAVEVTNSAAVGVGDLIRVGDERMIVLDRGMVGTGETLAADLDASSAGTSVTVTEGSGYHPGEVILIDAERMLVVDVAGDVLTVRRAVDGTVLASHTLGATVYAPRRLTVERGALGTTAGAHNSGDPITRHVWPPLVAQLAVAEAVAALQRQLAAYAQQAGTGQATRNLAGGQLDDLRHRAYTAHARKSRIRAV